MFEVPLIFNLFVLLIFAIYFIRNKEKAFFSLNLAFKSTVKIFPLILIVLFFMALIQNFLKNNLLTNYILSAEGIFGHIITASLGAVFHIPQFIAFPLGGQLLNQGIDPGIVATFVTTLVMVHTFSIPVEIKELGLKFAVTRNLLNFLFAIVIGFIVGVLY